MDHLITTNPVCEPCPRCGRLQLTGHAEGLAYRADPAPITAQAELDARLAGRNTYALYGGQLVSRTPSRIHGDTRRGRPPVYPQHRCEHPPTAADIDTAHLETTARLITQATPKDPPTPPVDDLEYAALALFTRELGAHVIERRPAEPAPF